MPIIADIFSPHPPFSLTLECLRFGRCWQNNDFLARVEFDIQIILAGHQGVIDKYFDMAAHSPLGSTQALPDTGVLALQDSQQFIQCGGFKQNLALAPAISAQS